MNPETGEGFDAVQVGSEEYFDANATDNKWPGALGLQMRKTTWWQGDVEFDTFDTVGPVMGDGPGSTIIVSGPGGTTPLGVANGFPEGGINADGTPRTPTGSTAEGTNTVKPTPRPFGYIVGSHPITPCYEDDGSPTYADAFQHYLDITLIGAYGGDIKFPVMPADFGASFTHEYWTPKVVGLGEMVLPGGDMMETITWDSFFPSSYDSDYVIVAPTELEDPRSLSSRIIFTMRYKMDCMLVVGNGLWNDRVVITSFSYKHMAGEPFDIYYTIAFKRFRAPIVTTSPNPDAMRDRWYKDPRTTGTQTADPAAVAPAVGSTLEPDPNPAEVIITPDPYVTVPFDQGPAVAPGREMLVTIESDQKVTWDSVNGMHAYQGQASQEPELGRPREPIGGETLQEVSERLSKYGPNDVPGLLLINKWITDNNYDPYTSHLPIGSGLRYYKNNPVTAAKPLVITTPYFPIAAPRPSPDVNGANPKFGPVPQVSFPGSNTIVPGVPGSMPQEVELAPPAR